MVTNCVHVYVIGLSWHNTPRVLEDQGNIVKDGKKRTALRRNYEGQAYVFIIPCL